jgi:transcriptional regulator with XRE-family HTH domain
LSSHPILSGEKIELHRKRKGLSRKTLAGLVGRSQEWLRQIEKGIRPLDSLESLCRIAEALRLNDWTELISRSCEPEHRDRVRGRAGFVREIQRSLLNLADETGQPPAEPGELVRELGQQVAVAWRRWRSPGRLAEETAPAIPGMLDRSLLAMRLCARDKLTCLLSAQRVHIQVLQLARAVLDAIAEHWLAYVAAVHAMALTPQVECDIVRATCSCGTALALSRLGFFDEAQHLVRREVVALGRSGSRLQDRIVVSGALLLAGADGAARAGRYDDCRAFLDRAHRLTASQHTDLHDRFPSFGPVSAQVQEVSCLLRLGRLDLGMQLAERVRIEEHHPVDEQVELHTWLAHAHSIRHNHLEALLALLKVERLARDHLRHDQLNRDTVDRLMKAASAPVHSELTRLATITHATG